MVSLIMKRLYIVRHAKSDWSFDVDDFDRPLNERGKRDAPTMAARLKQRNVQLDALVSSTAVRAWRTAQLFAVVYEREDGAIIGIPKLYHASAETIFDVIEGISDDFQSIAIFTHNNGITDFANSLGIIRIDNMPTCSVLGFAANTNEWKEIRKAEKMLLFFDYPKQK
jgi:phosphohistidine phosphatase